MWQEEHSQEWTERPTPYYTAGPHGAEDHATRGAFSSHENCGA